MYEANKDTREREKGEQKNGGTVMPDTWEETEMAQNGPIVSDAYFFGECLNWEAGGMEAVRAAAEREDYPAARHALAQVIRDWAAE